MASALPCALGLALLSLGPMLALALAWGRMGTEIAPGSGRSAATLAQGISGAAHPESSLAAVRLQPREWRTQPGMGTRAAQSQLLVPAWGTWLPAVFATCGRTGQVHGAGSAVVGTAFSWQMGEPGVGTGGAGEIHELGFVLRAWGASGSTAETRADWPSGGSWSSSPPWCPGHCSPGCVGEHGRGPVSVVGSSGTGFCAWALRPGSPCTPGLGWGGERWASALLAEKPFALVPLPWPILQCQAAAGLGRGWLRGGAGGCA